MPPYLTPTNLTTTFHMYFVLSHHQPLVKEIFCRIHNRRIYIRLANKKTLSQKVYQYTTIISLPPLLPPLLPPPPPLPTVTVKVTDKKRALNEMRQLGGINDMDIKISLIQALIPVGLERVKDILQSEVMRLAREPRKHGKINTRWGYQDGSVYLLDQKVPIDVPRVRNKELNNIYDDLNNINPSAASSLAEGMEDTLTLHRLGLNKELKKSFSSTNCIESLMSHLGQYTDKVDRWRNGRHIQEWTASGLLRIESNLKKVYGWRHMKLLRDRICQDIDKQNKKQEINKPELMAITV